MQTLTWPTSIKYGVSKDGQSHWLIIAETDRDPPESELVIFGKTPKALHDLLMQGIASIPEEAK